METKIGIGKVKISKSGRHIHVQEFSKNPPGKVYYEPILTNIGKIVNGIGLFKIDIGGHITL